MKTYGLVQLLCLISIVNAQSIDYTLTRNVNIGSSLQQQTVLIASFKTIDRLLCIGACNRNTSCLSCSYNQRNTTTSVDCYLYNRVFTSSDFTNANNVDWYSKKGATPSQNIISSGCNCSLMFYLRNTTRNSSITSYNGYPFEVLYSTEMAIVNNTPVYFLADYDASALVKMSSTWQYIRMVNTISNPRVIKWANDQLYISSNDGFYKMDYNFNIKKSIVDTGACYNAIYHNSSDNTLAVAVWSRNRVDWIDGNLTVLANISVGTYFPVGVSGYGDLLYVSAYRVVTPSTVIYVIRNRVINNTLTISTTIEMQIHSIIFDDYGYMALTFETEKALMLYHINGTSTGFNLTFPTWVYHINFDFNRRMMISTAAALYFFN